MEGLPEKLASSNAVKIAKRLGTISGGRVLDVGTGDGNFIRTLMKTLKDYDSFVGIDYCPSVESREEMESAKKSFKGKLVQLIQMDAEDLQFEDESFDTVCIAYTLHHLAHIDRVLVEMMRVLKNGGNFILHECYCDGNQTRAQRVDIRRHTWLAQIGTLLGITHNKTLPKQRIMDIACNLNLRELEVFDSTHSVDCLFCEKRNECEDPKNQSTYRKSIKGMDSTIKRIEDYPDVKMRNRLKEEADRIKKEIGKYGSAASSTLFIIGKK